METPRKDERFFPFGRELKFSLFSQLLFFYVLHVNLKDEKLREDINNVMMNTTISIHSLGENRLD